VLLSGEGRLRRNRAVFVVGDVLTADHDRQPSTCGVARAADDAGVEATGGVAKAAADAGPLITNDITLPCNETTKGRFGKPIPASDDQIVRPTAIARSEGGRGRFRALGSLTWIFIIANDQIAKAARIAVVEGAARTADNMNIGTAKNDIRPSHANLRVGIDADKRDQAVARDWI
jgi:hypothetical protein